MPEEINRILTDNVSQLLLCPAGAAVNNLMSEGFGNGSARVVNVGDVMQDSSIFFRGRGIRPRDFSDALSQTGSTVDRKQARETERGRADPSDVAAGFILATLHRAENTDSPERLRAIVKALNAVHTQVAPVVLPLHPRTRAALDRIGLSLECATIDPTAYPEMVWLLDHCQLVLTDSGGVQKEAFFLGKSCVTMRDQTEWVELMEIGANELVGASIQDIIDAAKRSYGRQIMDDDQLYGVLRAADQIVWELAR